MIQGTKQNGSREKRTCKTKAWLERKMEEKRQTKIKNERTNKKKKHIHGPGPHSKGT